jgi:hypothetical protein
MTPRCFKPPPWKVLKAPGITLIECKLTRFTFAAIYDEDAKALAALLTRKDREIARLKHRINEMTERS